MRLERSAEDRLLAGVCGGLAAATQVPALAMRLVFLVLCFAYGLGALLYVALALFLPIQGDDPPRARVAENGRELLGRLGAAGSEAFTRMSEAVRDVTHQLPPGREQIGFLLLVGGVLLLAWSIDLLDWLNLGGVLGIGAVVIGYVLMVGRPPSS
jgi:phage shock protein PspC (stress-responsive transcriptional regulator)